LFFITGFQGYNEWIIQLNWKNYKLYVKLKKRDKGLGTLFFLFQKDFFLGEKRRIG
jgi:hypothetical protein